MNFIKITAFYRIQYLEICILYIIFLFIVILFLFLAVHVAQCQNENGTKNEWWKKEEKKRFDGNRTPSDCGVYKKEVHSDKENYDRTFSF